MKFKFTKKTKIIANIKLKQIVATKDFANVKKGEIGGWLEKKDNLLEDGDA